MTIIESVRDFLATCPLLADDKLNVDFLPAEAATYSVDVVPVRPVLKKWLDGSSRRQFLFVLSTRTYYGAHIRQQLDNLGFFEEFGDWLETASMQKNFPVLDTGKTPQSMEINTSGYVFNPGTDTARYQIQCKMIYIQKGER